MIRHILPSVYSNFLPKELLNFEIQEVKSTCSDCAMQEGRTRTKVTYRGDLKCCTYEPWIPNYAVGGILKESDSCDWNRVCVQKIRDREYALPLGLLPSVRFQVEFNSKKKNEFGNREDWLCPYYDREQQACSIWLYRGSVCSSFFCKSVFGEKGIRYWALLQNYLSYIEMALAEDCLASFGFSPRQLSHLLGFLNRKSGTARELRQWVLPEVQARHLWNGYFDEQEEFFLKCFSYVQNLSKREFEQALGELGSRLKDRVLAQQAKLI